jgi:phosphatidate cytidylyltransferase
MNILFGLPEHVVYATAGVWALLIAATIIVLVLRKRHPDEYDKLVHRATSWWWMIGAFTFAIAVSKVVAVVFLAFVSYLALKEYLSLIPTRRIDRGLLLFVYLAIPIQYYWAAIDWYGMFIVFVPCGYFCSSRRSWHCAATRADS